MNSLVLTLLSVSTLAQTQISTDVPTAVQAEEAGRVRWGIDAQLGAFLPQTAAMFGLEGRVGYQFNSTFALYANVTGNVGVGSARGAPTVASALAAGILGEVTVIDRLSFGLGPVLATGAWVGAANSSTTVTATGWMPGVDVKVGYNFGSRNPTTGRRSGFNLGIDLLTVFSPNATYQTDTSTKTGLAVGFVPTLTLGFDAR